MQTSCMQVAVGIRSDEAAGNVEVHGGSRSIVGYQVGCRGPGSGIFYLVWYVISV